jgi:hypothetical protein
LGVYFNKKRKLRHYAQILKWHGKLFLSYIPNRLSAYWRQDPDFLIIGAMKCGTTFLYHYLNEHPEIEMSRVQEVNYFSRHYYRSKWYYRSFFPFKSKGMKSGESGIHYIFDPRCAARIKKDLPNTKIILLMRNPIDRAQSHYNQIHTIDPANDFEHAIELEQERIGRLQEKIANSKYYTSVEYETYSYANRGLYFEQLSIWLKHYKLEELLIIKSEDMYADPKKVFERVYKHIGVSVNFPKNIKPQNSREYEPMSVSLRNKLKAFYAEDSKKLVALLGDNFKWND